MIILLGFLYDCVRGLVRHARTAGSNSNRTGGYPYVHSATNHWIELTGADRAEGRCYLTCWVTAQAERNPLLLLGIYADGYSKRGGVWQIEKPRVDYVWLRREVVGGVPGAESNRPS